MQPTVLRKHCVPSLLVLAVACGDEGSQGTGGRGTRGDNTEKSKWIKFRAMGWRGIEQKCGQRNRVWKASTGSCLPSEYLLNELFLAAC